MAMQKARNTETLRSREMALCEWSSALAGGVLFRLWVCDGQQQSHNRDPVH